MLTELFVDHAFIWVNVSGMLFLSSIMAESDQITDFKVKLASH